MLKKALIIITFAFLFLIAPSSVNAVQCQIPSNMPYILQGTSFDVSCWDLPKNTKYYISIWADQYKGEYVITTNNQGLAVFTIPSMPKGHYFLDVVSSITRLALGKFSFDITDVVPTSNPNAAPTPMKPMDVTCDGGKGVKTAIGCIPTDPEALVAFILQFAIGIGGGIALLLIVWGAFQIITSGGTPEKLNNGKEIIVSAVSGLLMIIFSIFLLGFIGVDILQIPGFTK